MLSTTTVKLPRKNVSHHGRWCGKSRLAGGFYAVTSEEHFRKNEFGVYDLAPYLVDPPIPVDPTKWGLCAQGVSYSQDVGGIWHAKDWIGLEYPNTADYLMETVTIGGSGLFPLSEQVKLLTPHKSWRLCFHPRAFIKNPLPFKENLIIDKKFPGCPLPTGPVHDYHESVNGQMCALLHWQDLMDVKSHEDRFVTRQMPNGGVYQGAVPPEGVTPEFRLAYFLRLPIDEFHVVEGDDEKVNKAINLLSQMTQGIPWFLTNY